MIYCDGEVVDFWFLLECVVVVCIGEVKWVMYELLLWVDVCVRVDKGVGEVDVVVGGLDVDGVSVGFGEEWFLCVWFECVVEGEDFVVVGEL